MFKTDKPISLSSLVFSDKKGKLIVKEDYLLIFDCPENMEKFIQSRYEYWKETLKKELVMAPEHNETIDELGIRKIFDITGDFLQVNNILSETRKIGIIEARRFAIAICVEQGQLVTNIANAINYSHSNIIHHRDKFYQLCEGEIGYLDKFVGVKDYVLNKLNDNDKPGE